VTGVLPEAGGVLGGVAGHDGVGLGRALDGLDDM
jgi:hypothetical protein